MYSDLKFISLLPFLFQNISQPLNQTMYRLFFMPKKYKIPEPEPSVINGPSVSYRTGYTSRISSKRKTAKAIEDYKEGEYMSHQEMKKMFF